MNDLEFESMLDHYSELARKGINRYLPIANDRPPRLHEAMRYSLGGGGKLIRPVLVLAGNSLYPTLADPIPAAVAVECLHTYSLIHDDLPSMDDSDLRRGRATCHVQYDEATAVLAGDALLTHAFWLLADSYRDLPEIATSLIHELGDAAGSRKLIGGQMEDILGEKNDYTAEQIDFIHLNKTAALFTSSLMMGVYTTTANQATHHSIRTVGRNLGLAYQIIDDVLDATSDSSTLGKTAGADMVNEKNTYVNLHGLDHSRAKAKELTGSAIEHLSQLDADTTFIETLIQRLEFRLK